MKFYLIITHTCYCGEESYYYVKVNADGKVMDVGYDTTLKEYADYLAYENADEWWTMKQNSILMEISQLMSQKPTLILKRSVKKNI